MCAPLDAPHTRLSRFSLPVLALFYADVVPGNIVTNSTAGDEMKKLSRFFGNLFLVLEAHG